MYFGTNLIDGNMFFCDSCRTHCRKLNMIISIFHGVTAILIKANMWDRVYPSVFKHTFLHIAQNDISTLFASGGAGWGWGMVMGSSEAKNCSWWSPIPEK